MNKYHQGWEKNQNKLRVVVYYQGRELYRDYDMNSLSPTDFGLIAGLVEQIKQDERNNF